MRTILVALAVLILSGSAALPPEGLTPTIYDDGLSCPGGCDAHIVLNAADNGTRRAFNPASTRANPRACVNGQMCRICFEAGDDSCMTARYRGGGPPAGKVDGTPAFYAANCGQPGIPVALQRYCSALDRGVVNAGYDRMVNCLAGSDDPRCTPIMTSARADADADAPKLATCLRLGQARYNQSVPAPQRRWHGCLYSFGKTGGPNANGVRWRRLMPAACRPGTYVGRDGLDCCSSDVRFAASVKPECSAFFLPRRP